MHTPHPGSGSPEDGQEDLRAKLLAKGDDLGVCARIQNVGGDLRPVSLEGRKEWKSQFLVGGELLLEVEYSGGEGGE